MLGLSACNSEKSTFKTEIATLESALEKQPSAENTLQLLTSYEGFMTQFPDDVEWNGRYLYRAAGLQYRARNYKRAVDYLNKGITDFKSSSATPQSLLLLGDIYEEKLLNEPEAKKVYQQFLDEFPNHPDKETAAFFFKPANEKLEKKIADLEAQLYYDAEKTKINPQIASNLRRVYTSYVDQVPEDLEGSAKYQLKSARLLLETNNYTGAGTLLDEGFGKFQNSKVAPDMLLLMADIQENYMLNEEASKKIAMNFIQKFPDHPQKEDAEFYLKPLNEKVQIQIDDLETEVYGDTVNYRVDQNLANRLIKKYLQFADLSPNSRQTPIYLYKAAEISRSVRNFQQAIDLWTNIYEKYPKYEKAPQALFLRGYVYENDLRDMEKAKPLYEEFVKKYPNHEMISSVKFSLDNLGKSPDEIMKLFEEKSKEAQ